MVPCRKNVRSWPATQNQARRPFLAGGSSAEALGLREAAGPERPTEGGREEGREGGRGREEEVSFSRTEWNEGRPSSSGFCANLLPSPKVSPHQHFPPPLGASPSLGPLGSPGWAGVGAIGTRRSTGVSAPLPAFEALTSSYSASLGSQSSGSSV